MGLVWAWSVAMAVAISFSVIALAQAWVRNRLTSRFTDDPLELAHPWTRVAFVIPATGYLAALALGLALSGLEIPVVMRVVLVASGFTVFSAATIVGLLVWPRSEEAERGMSPQDVVERSIVSGLTMTQPLLAQSLDAPRRRRSRRTGSWRDCQSLWPRISDQRRQDPRPDCAACLATLEARMLPSPPTTSSRMRTGPCRQPSASQP